MSEISHWRDRNFQNYDGYLSMNIDIKDNERIALFIDGANFYAAARALGSDIDYKRLLELFRERGRLVRALYYTALVEDQEYSPIRPLVDWLDYNGFTMVTKPTKEFTDSLGRRKIKGDMDIELAIDMLEMAPHLDHVILFQATAISAVSLRWSSAKACASALSARLNPIPRWLRMSYVGKQMISSNCRTSRKKSAAPINRALKTKKTTASTTIITRNMTTTQSSKP